MWTDNASNIDLLFYDPYAEIISQDAISLGDEPLTIGLFGLWGAGKSTLLNLIRKKYDATDDVLCVNINAWMFEGYEDAKTAVMEALLHALQEESALVAVKGKIKSLLKKLDLFKLGTSALKTTAPIVASLMTGNPLPVLVSLPSTSDEIGNAISAISESLQTAKDEYWKDEDDDDSDNSDKSTVNAVRKFRDDFESAIASTSLKRVVVLLDDLDRCQPDRIIETLEAIKLFLSVKKMTFIIAADENVIQYSIKKKYPPMDRFRVELDKEYVEKLIQLPITVPELSEKDIQNYLAILVYQKHLDNSAFDIFATDIRDQKLLINDDVISEEDFSNIIKERQIELTHSEEFHALIDVVMSIRGIVSSTLKGNPRQAKRFLNTFVTKSRLAQIYYSATEINPKILAKLLVLHKLDPELFNQLNEWNKSFDTENKRFREMRDSFHEESGNTDFSKWHRPKIAKWVICPPVELDKENLNKYFYLTRDILQTNSYIESPMSEQARKLLAEFGSITTGLLPTLIERIKKGLPEEDIDGILLTMVRKIEEGDVQSAVYCKLFVEFPMYRESIIKAIKAGNTKLSVKDIPSYSLMYSEEKEKIEDLLSSLQVKKEFINGVKGVKTEGK